MKRIISSLCICISLFSFVACKDKRNTKSEKKLTLTMAEPNPGDSISAWIDNAFIEKVAELSHGTIEIQLHTNGILGDNTSVMEVMTKPRSEIHLARIAPAAIAKYNCEKHELLDIPFTFVNREHFWKFASSQFAQAILNEPYEMKIGVKGLFFAEEGFRHFFSTKELESIADFKGKKMRNAGSAIMNDLAISLKCEPVSVPYSELYAALQTGVIDIAEQPIANYFANHLNKIAPYMLLDGHQLGVTEVVISSELWDKLTKEQQKIMQKAAQYAGEYCNKVSQEAENKSRLTLRTEGVTFREVKDIKEWRTACADVIHGAAKKNFELYAEIEKLAK
ncbi:MAG: TRAP transporter substrate-binding protein [Treponema sp.]|nr:TRAP transporter substrate-binding protein [Treponema sp.]